MKASRRSLLGWVPVFAGMVACESGPGAVAELDAAGVPEGGERSDARVDAATGGAGNDASDRMDAQAADAFAGAADADESPPLDPRCDGIFSLELTGITLSVPYYAVDELEGCCRSDGTCGGWAEGLRGTTAAFSVSPGLGCASRGELYAGIEPMYFLTLSVHGASIPCDGSQRDAAPEDAATDGSVVDATHATDATDAADALREAGWPASD